MITVPYTEFHFTEKDFTAVDLENENWLYICAYRTLSEDFIRKFECFMYWGHISYLQILSEDFIREFQYKVNWINVCRHQVLSKEFIVEFADKINFNQIITNNKISQDVKDYCRMFL